MAISAKLQAARKQAQKERLKRKGKPGYQEYYANQPLQKIKAAENEEIRKAREDVRNALEDLKLAQVTGKGLQKAVDALPVKRLIVQRLLEQKRANKHPGVQLTSATGGES
ncbi:MAG: hypothetical protein QGD91_10225 [Actinomycetota bacterium]|nr:hypothetical protein [Actinomycetota bacterium]